MPEEESAIELSGVHLKDSNKYSLKEVMDGLENLEGDNFESSDIYRVCLPKITRSGTVINKAKQ